MARGSEKIFSPPEGRRYSGRYPEMLIFDLDGTLLDSNGVWLEVDKTFLARRNAPYTKEFHNGVAHTILSNAAVFIREHLKLEESCEAIIAELMDLAAGQYGRTVELKPHVRAYLDRCRAAGHRMAVFTACVPEHCQTAVRNHGLDVYFEKIIYAQELGEDKRSPTVFRQAAELLGVKPRECVFFDDSLAACKGAKAARMTVVGVRDSCFHGAEADMRELCDRYIADFGELL